MKKQEILKAMEQKIDCKKGCADCCGLVPFSLEEMSAIPAKMKQGIVFDIYGDQAMPRPKKGLQCPFVVENESNKQCGIYEYRPLMCKAFGRVVGLTCPHGANAPKLLKHKHMTHLMEKLKYPKPNRELQNSLRNVLESVSKKEY